jgi:hypothetical protein
LLLPHFANLACALCIIGDAAWSLSQLEFPLVTHGGDNVCCFHAAGPYSCDSLRGVEFVAVDRTTSDVGEDFYLF